MRYAVILAGGSGVRLWPASRRSSPKQFLPLGARAGESLIAATVRRLGGVCPQQNILVVTAAEQAGMVTDALPGLPAANVIAEPAARNTAAALGLAAVYLLARDPDAVMGALPADHHIADEAGFARVMDRAFAAAEAGLPGGSGLGSGPDSDSGRDSDIIVTVGIVPTRPETGFGYLHVGERVGDGPEAMETVARFVEKPDAATARTYIDSGQYLWNGGMFFVRARRLLRDIETHMPETHAGLAEIAAALAAGGERAAADAAERVYPALPKVSIDYGVMERASGVVTIRGDFGWNDVGSWSALADYRPADEHGNVTGGTVVVADADDNIIIADPGTAIAVVGVSGLVVVQSKNGILVIPRDRAQDVRRAVDALLQQNLDDYL